MKDINIEELKFKSEFGINHNQYQDGYRIVYFYSNEDYKVGPFCGTIEGFMMDFVETSPIENEEDVPKFISIDDLLSRYLSNLDNISAVAIYKTDGTLIKIKKRNIKNIKI